MDNETRRTRGNTARHQEREKGRVRLEMTLGKDRFVSRKTYELCGREKEIDSDSRRSQCRYQEDLIPALLPRWIREISEHSF